MLARDDFIHEAKLAGMIGLQESAAQDQIERRWQPDQPRQPGAAAPARNDAELHLRLAEPGGIRIAGDPRIAGERHLQAAADAAIALCEPAEDLRGDIEYKTAMAGAMVKRALAKAWARSV